MTRRSSTLIAVAVWALLLPALIVVAQSGNEKTYRRAKQPQLPPEPGIFFDDVFTKVIGERPGNLSAPPRVATGGPAGGGPMIGGPAGGGPSPAPSGGSGWSQIISPTTLEDEIKSIKLKVDEAVTTPTSFASRDYKLCRKYFSVAAMVFAIIEDYDGSVRWKDDATKLRDAFARAAGNCKTGSTQAYNEAKLRKQDLQDVVGGAAVNLPDGKPRENWEYVVDRSPLMQRLETAQQGKLQPLTASASSFSDNPEEILHEAEMVAAMGEVLQREGMMDAEDDDYNAFAEHMKAAALEVVDAVKSGAHDQAGKAVGEISKSCSECHELYRG